MVAEHVYTLRAGCAAQGCAVAFLAVIGGLALATLPAGYLRIVNGDVPFGVLLCVLGLIGLPALIFAAMLMLSSLREVLNPDQLVLTETAIVLPERLRGLPPDAQGNVPPNAPGPQPQLVPFSAIRTVKTSDGRGIRLQIEHELAPSPLVLHEFLMTPADFDALEAVLREAAPGAFVVPAPPSSTSP
jgi:hypothetical protein